MKTLKEVNSIIVETNSRDKEINLKLIKKAVGAIKFIKIGNVTKILITSDKYLAEVDPREGIITLGRGTVEESSSVYLASLLLHESHHIRQYKKGMRHSKKAETEAYGVQKRFLLKHGKKADVEWIEKDFEERFK